MELNEVQRGWVAKIQAADYRCALFARAGLGKTAVALKCVELTQMSWYVFTRRSYFDTWHKECAKWLPAELWPNVYMRSVDKWDTTEWRSAAYGVIIDESYHVKGHRSARHLALRRICDNASAVIILNQDPYVKSVHDLWAQMRLVLGGSHLTSQQLRSLYFVQDLQGFGFHEKPTAAESYRARKDIDAHAIFHWPASKRKVETRTVELSLTPKQKAAYQEVAQEMQVTCAGEKVEYRHMMEKTTRLHQICGGILPLEKQVVMLPSCKIWWLTGFLAREKGKVVVWCAYRAEVRRLVTLLERALNEPVGTYMGGEKPDIYARVVVATTSMGVSTNAFSQFPTAIYFSQNWKLYYKSQSMGRNDREDSKHTTVRYFNLICRNTIDSYIFESLQARGVTARKLFDVKKITNFLATHCAVP